MCSYTKLLAFCVVVILAGCRSGERRNDISRSSGLKPESAHSSNGPPAPVSEADSLRFTVPEGWIPEAPASSSRHAQYKLPRVSGDPEDAEMVVFYFQGGGGTPQANVERWIGQFQNPDGSSAGNNAQVGHRSIHGIPVTTLDVRGTYNNPTMMSMQAQARPREHFRMLAAIAETANGPWFFKLTGPQKTVAKWQPSFERFMDSLEQK
jgi:hypothetical protein